MLRILWTDKVSTCEVFRRAGVGKGVMQDMVRRQMPLIGHGVRKDELKKSNTNWICRRNRLSMKTNRNIFLTYLSKHEGIKPIEMTCQAIDRDMWI